MRTITSIAAVAAMLVMTPAVNATTLILDSGWQDDTTDVVSTPSESSPWDFTLTGNGIFSVTDAFLPGDIYTISGSVNGVTTYYAGSPSDVQSSGFYGGYWGDASFSKYAVALGAGTYSITITGDCGAGCPAGLAVRLDSAGAVPEPATWGMMLAGFGLIGFAARRRQSVKTTVTYA